MSTAIPEKKTFTKKTDDELQAQIEETRAKHDFYYLVKDKSGRYQDFKFYLIKYLEKLKSFGFFRYDLDNGGHNFVRVVNNTVKQITDTQIVDYFLDYIANLEQCLHEWKNEEGDHFNKVITSDMITEKMLRSLDIYFKKSLLNRLLPDKPINVKNDEKETKYLFYHNGFIKVTAENTTFHAYEELTEYIWEEQILQRDFNWHDKQQSFYEKFIMNISGNDKDRFLSMQTIIGYNLHNFNKYKLFATVLTDSKISLDGEANGRTGKTLWGKGLGHMLNTDEKSTVYTEINGRDFDTTKDVKYTNSNLNTALIHINDCRNKFNIETMFNDITEGIKVKKLFQDPFIIHPKLILSSNQTIIIEGESAKDRVVQFEFSDYYNSERNPAQEFGHWFFDEWDSQEWNRFDGFMIDCIKKFLQNGIVRPQIINLKIRELQDHTAREFISFMDDLFDCGIEADGQENLFNNEPGLIMIKEDEKYDKADLFRLFIKTNPDFNNPKFKQRTFTKWVRMYCKNKLKVMDEIRSGGKDFFTFK